MATPAWQWNELQHVGSNFSDIQEVQTYDERMAELRDVAAENQRILDAIQLTRHSRVLEVGTGTGAFARAAAKQCEEVIALDISAVMLNYAAEQAERENLDNIRFLHTGILSYNHTSEPFDAVVSCMVLHHLPDLWKAIALRRIYSWLKPGGVFYLQDVVFSEEAVTDPCCYFDRIIATMPECMRGKFQGHIRQEYSTLESVMQELIETAGLEIEFINAEEFVLHYLCRKPKP